MVHHESVPVEHTVLVIAAARINSRIRLPDKRIVPRLCRIRPGFLLPNTRQDAVEFQFWMALPQGKYRFSRPDITAEAHATQEIRISLVDQYADLVG